MSDHRHRSPGARRLRIPVRGAVALALIVVASLTALAVARPGDPDTGFGVNGRATLDLGGNDYGNAVLVQPDGRIVVAGSVGTNEDILLARFTAAGAPDPAFDGDGQVQLDFGGDDHGLALGRQADGALVVAGWSRIGTDKPDIVVARRKADGTTDNSFNGIGRRTIDYGGQDVARALAVQTDGRIVVVGGGNPAANISITRLLPGGTPDPAFDGDGAAGIGFGLLGGDEGSAVAAYPDGRILFGGTAVVGNPNVDVVLGRLTSTGALDPSFDGDGRKFLDLGSRQQLGAVLLRPDGRIVAVGTSDGDMTVTQLLANGTLDPAFGTAGTLRIDLGGQEFGEAAALQPDGKIVVAGATSKTGAKPLWAVARVQPGGTLDSTFGTGGARTLDLASVDADANGVALQADGRIVVAGTGLITTDVALARLDGDPLPPGAAPGTTPGGGSGGGGGGGGTGATSSRIPLCAGARATIVGTPGRDRLTGTPRRDVIAGLAGDDVIRGLGGADLVCGGPGADTISGGPGADRLLGQAGRDRIAGGAGRDALIGGAARDLCAGGPGRDRGSCERER